MLNLVPVGVLGAESGTGGARLGCKFKVDFLGGEVLRSIAEVAWVGVLGGFVAVERGPVMPGDAVWALDGGGGGANLVAVFSLPAYR